MTIKDKEVRKRIEMLSRTYLIHTMWSHVVIVIAAASHK